MALKICLMNQRDFSKLSGSSCQSPNPDSNELEFEQELRNIWQPGDAQRNTSGEWDPEVGGAAEKLQINFVLTLSLESSSGENTIIVHKYIKTEGNESIAAPLQPLPLCLTPVLIQCLLTLLSGQQRDLLVRI